MCPYNCQNVNMSLFILIHRSFSQQKCFTDEHHNCKIKGGASSYLSPRTTDHLTLRNQCNQTLLCHFQISVRMFVCDHCHSLREECFVETNDSTRLATDSQENIFHSPHPHPSSNSSMYSQKSGTLFLWGL